MERQNSKLIEVSSEQQSDAMEPSNTNEGKPIQR